MRVQAVHLMEVHPHPEYTYVVATMIGTPRAIAPLMTRIHNEAEGEAQVATTREVGAAHRNSEAILRGTS